MKFSNTVTSALATAVFGFVALGLTSTPAAAATTTITTNFLVTATVAANCTVGATAMGFGTYSGAALPATSTVTVTCTNTTPYTLGLDKGSGASVTNRSMTGPGAALLNYGLFSDASRTANFATTASITGTGAAQPVTVYGQVPAAQFVAPGAYTDTITATVTY